MMEGEKAVQWKGRREGNKGMEDKGGRRGMERQMNGWTKYPEREDGRKTKTV